MPLGGSFLLMEHMPFIPFGQSIPEVLQNLGEGLAAMHLQEPLPGVDGFGFYGDNFLGGTRQANGWDSDFSSFFVEKRLLPQFARAKLKFKDSWGTNNEDFERIGGEAIRTAKKVLEPVANSTPALLHGGELKERRRVHDRKEAQGAGQQCVLWPPFCCIGNPSPAFEWHACLLWGYSRIVRDRNEFCPGWGVLCFLWYLAY